MTREASTKGARPELVLALDDPAAVPVVAGGKGASLGRLARAGFRVPAGFHVTTAAYLDSLDGGALREELLAAVSSVDGAPDAATSAVVAARIGELFASRPPDVAAVDRGSGALVSYQLGGKEVMTVADGAPRSGRCWWRRPTCSPVTAADPGRRADYYDGRAVPAAVRDPDAVITGFPGAAGVVEGTARVLSAPEDGARLGDGEILVTTVTNIGWTPIFPRAGAVVTDVGAPLSHAAIVARELGIPAVVGCGDATVRLRSGDRVRVDGSAGTVEILDRR